MSTIENRTRGPEAFARIFGLVGRAPRALRILPCHLPDATVRRKTERSQPGSQESNNREDQENEPLEFWVILAQGARLIYMLET